MSMCPIRSRKCDGVGCTFSNDKGECLIKRCMEQYLENNKPISLTDLFYGDKEKQNSSLLNDYITIT